MKRTTVVAMGFALFASVCHAGDFWVTVGAPIDEPDDTFKVPVVAVDVSTLVYNAVNRKVWVYHMVPKREELTEVGSTRYSFRCDQQEMSAIQETQYNPDTLTVTNAEIQKAPVYASPIPGTLTETLYAFICEQQPGKPLEEKPGIQFRHEGTGDLQYLKETALRYWKYTELYRKLKKAEQ